MMCAGHKMQDIRVLRAGLIPSFLSPSITNRKFIYIQITLWLGMYFFSIFQFFYYFVIFKQLPCVSPGGRSDSYPLFPMDQTSGFQTFFLYPFELLFGSRASQNFLNFGINILLKMKLENRLFFNFEEGTHIIICELGRQCSGTQWVQLVNKRARIQIPADL